MRGGARLGEQATRPVPGSPGRGDPRPRPAPVPARAAALQRAAGNRAAARVLARWVKHPDSDKKGVMVPDVVAEDFARFNPPQNK